MPRLLAAVFALVGIVCLCVAVGNVVRVRAFLATAKSTPGSVIELVQSTDSEGGSSLAPKVRYMVADRPYEFTGSVASNPPAYQTGESVTVLYDPSNPGHGRIDAFWEHYFVAILCGILGSAFTAFSLGVLFVRRPRRRG